MRRIVEAVLLTALIVVAVALIASQAQISPKDANTDHPVNQQSGNETSSAVTVEAFEYPLKLTMTIGKTELDFGEPLPIFFTVMNIGDQNLTMSFADGCDHFSYVVYNDSGSIVVYTHVVVYPQVRIPVVMGPNARRTESWSWNQIGDLVYLGLDHDPPYYHKTVTPGGYQIVGLFESFTLNGLVVKTPSVSFTIHG